jgi:hypothetical protein
LGLPGLLCAQDMGAYSALIRHAHAQYEQQDHLGSALTYSEAFALLGGKGTVNDQYNAACSYALAAMPDSAFAHLFRISGSMDYANVGHLTTDEDLVGLHGDERWPQVVDQVKANKERIEANYDRPLKALLDSIFEEDQALRRSVAPMQEQYGHDSPEMSALWERILEKDRSNQALVSRILDERGWPGADLVGGKANQAVFLVVQHAELDMQLKYLPVMREAAAQGKLSGSKLALLEDRVALRQGMRQRYGSQIGYDPELGNYISPLEDPDRMDAWRAEVGLGPIADYVARWGITWDVEAYKAALPALEERIREQRE